MQEKEEFSFVDLVHQPDWKIMLLDIVKKEKIDPWAVDIEKLAKAYMEKIKELKEENLRIPANAILVCSILLRYKAKALEIKSMQDEKEEIPLADLGDIPDIEIVRPLREGALHLDDLVNSIERVLKKTKKKTYLKTIKEMAMDLDLKPEKFEEKREDFYIILNEKFKQKEMLSFSELIEKKEIQEIVEIFVYLLFLMTEKKIDILQEQAFGEIFIIKGEKNGS